MSLDELNAFESLRLFEEEKDLMTSMSLIFEYNFIKLMSLFAENCLESKISFELEKGFDNAMSLDEENTFVSNSFVLGVIIQYGLPLIQLCNPPVSTFGRTGAPPIQYFRVPSIFYSGC
jgi:hypothetical protein